MRIRPGTAAEFTTLGALDRRWQATVRQVLPSPEVLNEVVLYNVLVDVDNRDRQLMNGMSTQVFFILGEARNALAVPTSALGQRRPDQDQPGTQAYELRVRDGEKLATRVVQVGLLSRQFARGAQRPGRGRADRHAAPGRDQGGAAAGLFLMGTRSNPRRAFRGTAWLPARATAKHVSRWPDAAAGTDRHRTPLRQRRRAGAGAGRRVAEHRGRRVRGHHGPVRLRQEHADAHHRLPGPARRRPLPGPRPGRGGAGFRPAGRAAPPDLRLRVPALQPARRRQRAGQRGDAGHLRRPAQDRAGRPRAAPAGRTGPCRPRRAPPERAVRRPAAAGRHRPRADQRPAGDPGRRTDRRARQQEQRGTDGAAGAPAPGRAHGGADHARCPGRRARPARGAHRRRAHRGRSAGRPGTGAHARHRRAGRARHRAAAGTWRGHAHGAALAARQRPAHGADAAGHRHRRGVGGGHAGGGRRRQAAGAGADHRHGHQPDHGAAGRAGHSRRRRHRDPGAGGRRRHRRPAQRAAGAAGTQQPPDRARRQRRLPDHRAGQRHQPAGGARLAGRRRQLFQRARPARLRAGGGARANRRADAVSGTAPIRSGATCWCATCRSRSSA